MAISFFSDRIELLKPIEEGALADVWLAEHRVFDRKCAVKILRPELSGSTEFVQLFRISVKALRVLQHPNIVEFLDWGVLPDGRLYLAMEYVDGTRLDRVLHSRGRLPISQVLHLGIQFASALAYAHAKQILHGALAPSEILLVEEAGRVTFLKLVDFGLALTSAFKKAPDAGAVVLQQSLSYGSYTAPERHRGRLALNEHTVRHHMALDVYAFGAILYECATGSRPFGGELDAVIAAQAAGPPTRPSALRPEISASFDTLVLECLDLDPEQRPSAFAIGARLHAIRTEYLRIRAEAERQSTDLPPQPTPSESEEAEEAVDRIPPLKQLFRYAERLVDARLLPVSAHAHLVALRKEVDSFTLLWRLREEGQQILERGMQFARQAADRLLTEICELVEAQGDPKRRDPDSLQVDVHLLRNGTDDLVDLMRTSSDQLWRHSALLTSELEQRVGTICRIRHRFDLTMEILSVSLQIAPPSREYLIERREFRDWARTRNIELRE